MAYTKVGNIIHYFNKIQVAVVRITEGSLKVGDKILIGEEGKGFEQTVDSMQVDHEQINELTVGQEAGMKVSQHPHEGDNIYKVSE